MASKRAAGNQPELAWTTGSVEETQEVGVRLGRTLQPGDVVACFGELGSGKTTFIQGLAQGLGVNPDRVKSPTFVLQREYAGPMTLIHLDGYRLEGAADVAWLDVDLLFHPDKVTVIEWAQRFEGLLPDARLEIRLSHVSAHRRRLSVAGHGPRGEALKAQMASGASETGHMSAA